MSLKSHQKRRKRKNAVPTSVCSASRQEVFDSELMLKVFVLYSPDLMNPLTTSLFEEDALYYFYQAHHETPGALFSKKRWAISI
jgi:hypothetical protein